MIWEIEFGSNYRLWRIDIMYVILNLLSETTSNVEYLSIGLNYMLYGQSSFVA